MDNIFEHIPADLSEEVFEQLAGNDKVQIERIVSKGQSSPESGWYDQAHNEWVMVLKGRAKLCFEDLREITLGPGDHLDIKAHQKHKVSWTDPDVETIWLAVHYQD
ncbi:cupin domain-containing protein [Thalassomonas sp. RHCl1]|uniref:cupin domain-containing protein n=1 Tax=Thalassomonas sp. RHCl1 TaxID=2995320 RepID=UPI00248C0526|nr:cupin domain-containing protein [Thalassomonas sp. RHCl1]